MVEAQLADDAVHDAGRVVAEFDLSGLVLLYDFGHIGRHGAGTRRRHQTPRTEDIAEWSDEPHHVRGRDAGVEVDPTSLDLAQFFLTHDVGSGVFGRRHYVALGEHHDPLRPADSVRQHERTADDLIGLLRIDAQADGDLDGLVELGRIELPQLFDRCESWVGGGLFSAR